MKPKKDKPKAPPLVDTLRAALAQGWHSLTALDALAGGTASTRRARVHAALAELAAAGVAREERMGSTGAEVRLAPVTLPAPVPDDGDDGLDAEDREAASVAVEEDAERAKRYRFWSPSLGLGWLTWGEVCPSTPTRFEPDDGTAFEWIWNECGVGRPGKRAPRGTGPARLEWTEWQWFKTTGGETLVFRRGGAPPRTTAPTLTTEQRAETLAAIERVSVTSTSAQPCPPGRCRPPACHRDDIHEPSRVRSFNRPLCEAHRRWVEAAGGTVEPCPVCAGIEPVPLQQRCVGITHCAACMRALETLPMGAPSDARRS